MELKDVPNFIVAPEGYFQALQKFLLEKTNKKINFLKIPAQSDARVLKFAGSEFICIVAGQSPRGNHKH
eukprot:Pgem_evm1s18147